MAQGNAEAAIQIEKLGNELIHMHGINLVCGYFVGRIESRMDNDVFQRICAEHSAVHSH